MDDIRAQIVAEARSWIGTPHIHQHREKGVGVDCVGLLVGTAKALGMHAADVIGYARVPEGLELKRMCDAQMTEVNVSDMQPGDAVLLQFMGVPQHIAILGNYVHGGLSIIHANTAIGKVVEHRLTPEWRSRIVAAYKAPIAP